MSIEYHADHIIKTTREGAPIDESYISTIVDHPAIAKYTRIAEGVYSCRRYNPLEYTKSMRKMGQLVCGIGALHSRGYIHGDIKHNNLLQDDCSNIIIIDFDISLKLNTQTNDSWRMLYTTGYNPPETSKINDLWYRYTYAQDIWAMSLVILEYITRIDDLVYDTVTQRVAAAHKTAGLPPPEEREILEHVRQWAKYHPRLVFGAIAKQLGRVKKRGLRALLAAGLDENPAKRPCISAFIAYFKKYVDASYLWCCGKPFVMFS